MSPAVGGVLLLGATGRTGGRVLTQLLERGVSVCAIVRSAARLPAGAAADPMLTVVEADLASLPGDAWRRHVAGRDAVVSCLGHTISLRGVFGPPRDLVTGAVRAVCGAIEELRPATPVRLILMSSVSVNRQARADARRGVGERAYMAVLRALLPPARDNQRAADFLAREIGADHPSVAWVVVRPDALVDGEVSGYLAHDGIVASLFRPATTRMANVAHFMAEFATGGDAWRRWRGEMPVIVDEVVAAGGGSRATEFATDLVINRHDRLGVGDGVRSRDGHGDQHDTWSDFDHPWGRRSAFRCDNGGGTDASPLRSDLATTDE